MTAPTTAPDPLDAERAVPGTSEPGTIAFHLARYAFAAPFCRGRRVLDAGCGVGYGTALLADQAEEVVGIDYAPAAVAYAQRVYRRPNTRFLHHNLFETPYPEGPFDVVVCFEVAEHLPAGFDLFRALAQSLADGGVALVSTPNDLTWSRLEAAEYEFHVNMRDPRSLRREAETWFHEVEILGMRPAGARWYARLRALDGLNLRLSIPPALRRAGRAAAGVPRDSSMTPANVVIARDQLRQSHTLMALCRLPVRGGGG